MTQPSTPPSTPVLTRRQGLFALALATTGATIAACSSPSTPAPPTAPPSSATPQSETIRQEQELISKYDVAIAGVPTIAAALTALRDQHVEHIAALGGTASTASAPAGAVPGFPGPSAGQSAIIQALLEAERVAATERIEACVAATDPELARILTFIAASEASHLPALKDLQA